MPSREEPVRLPATRVDVEALDGPIVDGSTASVLIVDEDRDEAAKVADALEEMGLEADIVASPSLALEHLRERPYELVITEIFDGEITGLDVLRIAKEGEEDVEVIVLVARGDPTDAVTAMRLGALAYLPKPVHAMELRVVVRRALERVRLERRAVELERRLDSRYGFEAIVGNSPPMQRLFEQVRQVAPTNATVLLLGETGTGKDLVAKTIHQNSPRRRHSFVAINCASLSENLLESELFGHEKGAFTGATTQRKGRFEYASKGTVFLDELGEMPQATQVKLLRVLEEREVTRVGSNIPIRVDVRLIAATNADLEERIADGRFREDLYYRLKVVTIRLPPLRDRKGDIPLLVDRFVRELSKDYQKDIAGVTPEARRVLTNFGWPGNVRELRGAVEHMLVLANTPLLDVEHIEEGIRDAKHEPRKLEGLAGLSLEELEREMIRSTLHLTDGNREQAAKMLGIGERTLYRKLKKYDLR